MTNATPEPAHRRETVVSGKRVRVVDMHAHVGVAEANAIMGANPQPWLLIDDVRTRLNAMNAQAIDVEALSINPFWYAADRDTAAKVIAIQNEKLADWVASEPERFVGFASVALQHPDLAAQQLEDGVKKYNLRGALVGGSVEGVELADPMMNPFWAKAEELGVVIFIHPQGVAELNRTNRLKGNGILDNVIGNPLETTIALSHLIFEGTLDRYPGLKVLAAHGGGYLPSYAPRSDHGGMTFPERFTKLKRNPTDYLRGPQLYFDTLIFTPEALRHLIAETGVDRLVLGTDYPYPWTTTSVEHILETPGLTDEEKMAMLGGNAEKLLGL
jgi:aminocarboxymuconate-semialdehyde decarboxylase